MEMDYNIDKIEKSIEPDVFKLGSNCSTILQTFELFKDVAFNPSLPSS